MKLFKADEPDQTYRLFLEEGTGKIVQRPAEEFPKRPRLFVDTLVECVCSIKHERAMTESLQLTIIQVLLALAANSEIPLHGYSLNNCFVTLYNIYLSKHSIYFAEDLTKDEGKATENQGRHCFEVQ